MTPLDQWNTPLKRDLEGRTFTILHLEPQSCKMGDQLGRVTFGTFGFVRKWNVI